MALASSTANGGEERARASRERVREMRGRVREDERGTWGSRGTHRRLQASAEAGGGRRVAAGAGHALLVLLAGGGQRLARPVGWAEPGGLGQHR